MGKDDSLFLSIGASGMKDTRISLLSAQSGVLLSRERLEHLRKLHALGDEYRKSIFDLSHRLLYAIRRFKGTLPKPKLDVIREEEKRAVAMKHSVIPEVGSLKDASVRGSQDEISTELERIRAELTALGADI